MRQNHHYNTTMTCARVVGSKVKPLVDSLEDHTVVVSLSNAVLSCGSIVTLKVDH